MKNEKKNTWDPNSSNWGILNSNMPFESPISNWFGSGSTIPASNIYNGVNVEEISGLFSTMLRFRMPSSVRLMTITGSEVFVPDDVLELMNVSLVLSIKEQIEKSIFKHENRAVLDVIYAPQINGALSENYYAGYGLPNNDTRVVNAVTHAASRLVTLFKDLGIDLTSDIATNKTAGMRLRDIFMSAYVLSMQIIIMYNIRAETKQKTMEQPEPVKKHVINNLGGVNINDVFAMPVSESNIEAEHKPIFDGVKPDENGMFNIKFDEKSDEFTDMIEKARNFSLNNKKEDK